MLFLLLEKEDKDFYCVVIVILYCPLKEVFLYRNFQLKPGKVSVVRRCPLRTVRYMEVSL